MPGHIRKRGKRFEASISVPYRPRGPRRIYSSHATERAARAWVAEGTRSVLLGDYVEPSKITVADAFESYLEAGPGGATRKTRVSLGRRITDEFGSRPIQKISTPMLERFCSGLRAATRYDNGEPLAPHTIQNIVRIVRLFFKWAERQRLIGRSPAVGLKVPVRVTPKEMVILDPAGANALAAAVRGEPIESGVLLALYGGLRRGEALGLTWRDINDAVGVITIRRAMTVQPGGARLGQTKTVTSDRTIPIPRSTLARLSEIRDASAVASPYVCPRPQGVRHTKMAIGHRPYDPSIFSSDFGAFLAARGFAHMGVHDLRHTHVALLIAANVHIKVISLRLGHANIQITMDVYGHMIPGIDDGAMDALEALIAASRTERNPEQAA